MNKKLINEIERLKSLMGIEKPILNENSPRTFGDVASSLIRQSDDLSSEILNFARRNRVDVSDFDSFIQGSKRFEDLSTDLQRIIREVRFQII